MIGWTHQRSDRRVRTVRAAPRARRARPAWPSAPQRSRRSSPLPDAFRFRTSPRPGPRQPAGRPHLSIPRPGRTQSRFDVRSGRAIGAGRVRRTARRAHTLVGHGPASAHAPAPPHDLPRTLGDLRASGWTSVPVADELRRNAARRIAAGEPLVEGILGFEDTVIPQLENAILAGHDVILLGERGQAKTRIIRSLVDLLDEWLPIVAGTEINDDPYAADLALRAARGRRRGRRDADRLGAPLRALRREARHARHVDRRPHRRGRPHQDRRGPLPLRRAAPSTTASCPG